MARKSTARISTVEQLEVLAAPATFEVFEALQAAGPATVAELGPRLGRKPNSLHYHIRKLVGLGMVEQVDTRRSGARTEALYDVTADVFTGPPVPKNTQLRKATVDAVASILRLASRNYARAAQRPGTLTQTGRHRNILAHRQKAWLTKRELAEVNRHLEALSRIFITNQGTQRGTLCALTMVLTPVRQDSHSSG